MLIFLLNPKLKIRKDEYNFVFLYWSPKKECEKRQMNMKLVRNRYDSLTDTI